MASSDSPKFRVGVHYHSEPEYYYGDGWEAVPETKCTLTLEYQGMFGWQTIDSVEFKAGYLDRETTLAYMINLLDAHGVPDDDYTVYSW